MVTPASSKIVTEHGLPLPAQGVDVVRLFQQLLEDEESGEAFREFIVLAERWQTRLPWVPAF
jgi:hypothetical protein